MLKGRIIAVMYILIFAVVLLFLGSALFDQMDRFAWDMFMQSAASKKTGQSNTERTPITLITIDEKSFDRLQRRWPWPREWFAKAIDQATKAGATVIGVDISMSDPGFTEAEDTALAASIERSGRVVVVDNLQDTEKGVIRRVPTQKLLAPMAGTGFANLIVDSDNVVRNAVFVQSINDETVKFPSFATMIAATWFSAHGDDAKIETIPERAMVDYRQAGIEGFPAISFADLLSGNFDPALIKDRIVIIGATFRESHDFVSSPFEKQRASLGVQYGLEVNAHMTATLLAEKPLKPFSSALRLTVLVIALVIVLFILTFLPFYWSMGLCLLPEIAALSFSAWLFLAQGLWLAPGILLLPLLSGIPISVLYHFAIENREKRKVTTYFSRYVSPQVVDSMLSEDFNPTLGGELRDVTVLFSDIRDFTPLSENLSPTEIVSLLNSYFKEMVECVYREEGTVNKFIGDAIMVIYGAPVHQDDACERAVRTALDMRNSLANFNKQQVAQGKTELRVGIGIHCGQVVVGNIGSWRQMEYTVIGDVVNTCSRLESYTKEVGCDIIISEQVRQALEGTIKTEALPDVKLKGKRGTLTAYKLIDISRRNK